MRGFLCTDILNELPLFHQRFLVFDLIASCPGLDLIPMALELLDFAFEVILQLFLLRGICTLLNFLENGLECLNAFGNLFEGLVNVLLQLSLRHVGGCESVNGDAGWELDEVDV